MRTSPSINRNAADGAIISLILGNQSIYLSFCPSSFENGSDYILLAHCYILSSIWSSSRFATTLKTPVRKEPLDADKILSKSRHHLPLEEMYETTKRNTRRQDHLI